MSLGSSLHGTGSGANAALGSVLNANNSGGFNFMDSFKNLGNFFGSKGGEGLLGLGSLALQGYGLNKSLGFAEDQMDILKEQENRAATAQNLGTGNSLSLALQTTTPGTPEHERIKQAIATGQYQV